MCPLLSTCLAWDPSWSSVNHNKPFLLLSEWLWLSVVPAAGPVYLHLFLLYLDCSKYDHQKPVPSTAGTVVFMGRMNGNCCSVAFHACTAPSLTLFLLLHLGGLGKGKGGCQQSELRLSLEVRKELVPPEWVLIWCFCISILSRTFLPAPVSPTMSLLAAAAAMGSWSLSCVPGGKCEPQAMAAGTQGDQELHKTTIADFPLQLQALK